MNKNYEKMWNDAIAMFKRRDYTDTLDALEMIEVANTGELTRINVRVEVEGLDELRKQVDALLKLNDCRACSGWRTDGDGIYRKVRVGCDECNYGRKSCCCCR